MQKGIIFCLLLSANAVFGQLGTVTEHLKVDQFGYPPDAKKICVIQDPVTGFDAALTYTPGATLQVINAANDAVVFSAGRTSWHSGATYDQAGDRLWWFDFSTFTQNGTYYIYDPSNNTRSFNFEIREDVYAEALKQSMRTFFYQRSGFAKTETYAGVWNDGASHVGTQQDLDCRLVTNPVQSTSKQLQGGWYDAGDYNKYVNFCYEPIHDLMFAFIERPNIWTDDYNIPESGNGIPDLLDEVKWELDWLRRMQESNGSVLMKVSVTEWQAASPPSADNAFRRYGPAQASATRTFASMMAISAIAYNASGIPAMQQYADTLEEAAEDAWAWLVANPGFSNYNNQGFTSANPEISQYGQTSAQVGAAIALFALTGETTYRTYVDNNYTQIQPLQWTFWYPWEAIIQDLMLFYADLPNATQSVANAINNNFLNAMANNSHLVPAINNTSCGYRAFMNNGDNVWGSNRPRGHLGTTFYNMLSRGLSTDTSLYGNAALGYLNFLHGVNPVSRVMLTNMGDFGAEKSCDEMYHSWFGDGTDYDNAQTSLYGPAPGYQPGGFNPHYQPDPAYGGTIVPPQQQPSLKSYKDWNTSWPENSWEITEPAIYNQASYVKLVSKFVPALQCEMTITDESDSGVGSLRAAVTCAANGDTIRLDLNAGDTIELTSVLVIDKDLVILNENAGFAPVIASGNGIGFSVTAGSVVHLYNLLLIGQGTSLLENNGTLHLHTCRLDASQNSGPAIVNHGNGVVYGEVRLEE